MKVFEAGLANVYDLIYQDKNYGEEVDFIEEIFHNFALKPIKSILEGGCGTGGHAIPLATRGYNVTAIDLSENMIEHASQKIREAGLDATFKTMDIRDIDLNQKFDACLCMFAVLGYVTDTAELLETFHKIKKHLKKSGMFIFDCWNGLAVMKSLPKVRTADFEDDQRRVIRNIKPELDAFNHICKLHHHIIVFNKSGDVDEIKETHHVRFYFPQEIIHYLSEAGFEVLDICPFLDFGGRINEDLWNMTVIARPKNGT